MSRLSFLSRRPPMVGNKWCCLILLSLIYITVFIISTTSLSSRSHNEAAFTSKEGWKTIDLFYGKIDNVPNYYSQANQSEAVLAMLNGKRNGYFVELAAHDAYFLSNSYVLEKNNEWNGLCIEANPLYWGSLAQRRCKVVGAAVGGKKMEEINFRIDNEALGGVIGESFDNKPRSKNRKQNLRHKVVRMFTVSLREIFHIFKVPKIIDYLSLDVEGAEELVLSNFPFNEYSFTILSIERPSQSLKSLLTGRGYTFVRQITAFGETFWINQAEKDKLNMTYFESHYSNMFTIYEK